MPGQAGRCLLRALAAVVMLGAAHVSAAGAGEIHVGLAAPLTGRMAPVGLAMRRALEAAVADANAAGGLLGQRLALDVADDACQGAAAEGAAVTLLAHKPALVVGHPCSGAATAAARLYTAAGVLMIAVGARHPDVTAAGAAAPVLRLAGRDDRQGVAAARWLVAKLPKRQIAIVHDPTAYAQALAHATLAALRAAGEEPAAFIAIAARQRDYGDAVKRLGASGAGAVLMAGYPDEATILVRGIEHAGLDILVLGSDTLATPGFAEVAGSARVSVQVLLPAEPRPAGGSDAEAPGARARGALEAWLATARRIGATDAGRVAGALRGEHVETPSLGVISFTDDGDLVGLDFVPASAHGGGWVPDN